MILKASIARIKNDDILSDDTFDYTPAIDTYGIYCD